MPALIRKLVRFDETQFIEGSKPSAPPLRLITAAAVIRDPIEHGSAPIHTLSCGSQSRTPLDASIGGHPYHRTGDRYQDLKDLGHELEQLAG